MAKNNLTLLDIARLQDPSGATAKVVEVLNETNEMLADMPFIKCNDGSRHTTTLRTDEPTGTWLTNGEYIPHEKSTTRSFSDPTAMCKSLSQVDADLIRYAGGMGSQEGRAARFNEEKPFIAGLGKNNGNKLIYGSTVQDAKCFNGLATRFNSLAGSLKNQMIDFGGSGANLTSIYLLCLNEDFVHGVIPNLPHVKSGVEMIDQGKTQDTIIEDGIRKSKFLYSTEFVFHSGLVVRNPKGVVRLCNVDLEAIRSNSSGVNSLIEAVIYATGQLDTEAEKTARLYMPKQAQTILQIVANRKENTVLSWDEIAGKKYLRFNGMPVRICDAIKTTEAKVV